jgi:hypothetical protein
MIWMKSRYDGLNQCSTSALGHLMSFKERAMRRRERSDLEASLEHVCRSDNIRKDASTSRTPRVPRRSHEILRDLGMSDGEITEYFYRF